MKQCRQNGQKVTTKVILCTYGINVSGELYAYQLYLFFIYYYSNMVSLCSIKMSKGKLIYTM